jgi:eukaryotic-like serine/threonine-protein kinase
MGSLRRQLRGNLDWITMKALEKDRTRRYSSAFEFGQDLRRHLLGEPIVAGPPNPLRKLRGLIRSRPVVPAFIVLIASFLLNAVLTLIPDSPYPILELLVLGLNVLYQYTTPRSRAVM